MSVDVVTLALAKAYADELVANGGDPEKTEQIIRDKIDEVLGEIGNIGGSADWAVNDETAAGYIKNRTHYENVKLSLPTNSAILEEEGNWIGPAEGEQGILMGAIADTIPLYAHKISDQSLTLKEMQNITLSDLNISVGGTFTPSNTVYERLEVVEVAPDMIIQLTAFWEEDTLSAPVIISLLSDIDLTDMGMEGIAEKGTYFTYASTEGTEMYISRVRVSEVKQLDLKYIPEIAFATAELSKSGTVATLSITDRNGKKQTINIFDGPEGKSPERGKDYWTDEDIAVIKGYVENAIIGGSW